MPTFEITSPDGAKYHIEGPPGATEQDALAQVQAQHGSAPVATGGSSAIGDIAKSFGSGLVRGGAGLVGLPGDIADLATKGINYATGANLQNKVPLANSQMVLDRLQKDYGQLHTPEGTAGQYAQTVGEFAPGMLLPGSPGAGLARKALTNVAAPAIASETAGQLTSGTAAEPYARFAGGLAGGVAGARLGAEKPPAPLAAKDIIAAGSEGYKSPAITDVVFKRNVVEDVSDQAQRMLRAQRFNDSNAKKVFDTLEDLKEPVGPQQSMNLPGAPYSPPVKASVALEGGAPMHTFEDFQAVRSRLSDYAKNFNDPDQQKAAVIAKQFLDNYTGNVPQSHLVAGNAQAFGQTLAKARADYGVGKTMQRVEEAQRNAVIKAGSANSGANVNNVTRQQLRPFLTTKKGQMGLSPEAKDALTTAVVGSPLGNQLRSTGNYIRGNQGLGAAAGAFVGSGGNPLPLFAPLVGTALKKMGDAVTRRNVDKVLEAIQQRSPTAQAHNASIANFPKPGILPWPTFLLGGLGLHGGNAVPLKIDKR